MSNFNTYRRSTEEMARPHGYQQALRVHPVIRIQRTLETRFVTKKDGVGDKRGLREAPMITDLLELVIREKVSLFKPQIVF
jgi:hypothetical protein